MSSKPVKPPAVPRTDEEISKAIAALSDADLLKLKSAARFRARKLNGYGLGTDADDLLYDAILRTIEGQRQWATGVPLVKHLLGCIRSLASHAVEKGAAGRPLKSAVDDPSLPHDSALASQMPDGERVLHAHEQLAEIQRRFADDVEVLLVAEPLSKGFTGPEIQQDLGLTPTQYETIVMRLRRGIDREAGWRL